MSVSDEEEEGYEYVPPPNYPFSLWAVAYNILVFLSNVAGCTAQFLGAVSNDVAAANNHKISERVKREELDALEAMKRASEEAS